MRISKLKAKSKKAVSIATEHNISRIRNSKNQRIQDTQWTVKRVQVSISYRSMIFRFVGFLNILDCSMFSYILFSWRCWLFFLWWSIILFRDLQHCGIECIRNDRFLLKNNVNVRQGNVLMQHMAFRWRTGFVPMHRMKKVYLFMVRFDFISKNFKNDFNSCI